MANSIIPAASPDTVDDPSNPIPPARFANALLSLPISALHSKTAELQNALAHLHESNAYMIPYAEAGDFECQTARTENEVVMSRLEERVRLIRDEIGRRGMGGGGEGGCRAVVDATGWEAEEGVNGDRNGEGEGLQPQARNGSVTDAELRRRVEAQMNNDEEEEGGDGVHL
ncbi:hypothetical protein B0A50_06090 [Salinomyces thailandicus]|uniref:Uncharacterized protein n=1 Tax=Salinomyces thailandicus TaxID=706561 RepID=A0A4U0TSU3_9PEZI|nr:hypothetical protein B0A50_06090 [Salinomyces thailandica]